MPVTLFELTVPRFRRALGVIVHLLDRAEAHCPPTAQLRQIRMHREASICTTFHHVRHSSCCENSPSLSLVA